MERLKKWLYPNIPLRIALIIISTVMLIYVFAFEYDNSPIAYIAYVLSAYAVTIFTISMIQIIKRCKSIVKANPYVERYIEDMELRAAISLSVSTLMNILYAAFRIVSAMLYHSVWSGAVGGYYVVLSLIRIMLLRNGRAIRKQSEAQKDKEWRSYRLCGILLFILNLAMAAMSAQMIWQNKTYDYPGMMIYVSAMYTFYSFTMAIVNSVKFHKRNNTILSAAKMINLAGALMSIFALQTAMLTQFGGEVEMRQTMNLITGVSVCVIVLLIAIFMIIRSNMEVKMNE